MPNSSEKSDIVSGGYHFFNENGEKRSQATGKSEIVWRAVGHKLSVSRVKKPTVMAPVKEDEEEDNICHPFKHIYLYSHCQNDALAGP